MPNDRPSRRSLLKGLGTLPVAAAVGVPAAQAAPPAPPYQPTFFNAAEWAFVVAVCDRLIPHDEHGPGAVESGVPEFLDRHMQTPYAAGDIWYMQGPFLEAAPQFGYQGRLPLRDLLRVGMQAVDRYCAQTANGKSFAQLDGATQDKLLAALEKGDVKLDDIAARTFFASLLNEVRFGYFADPKYGGNKDMGSWKMIGYPGPRGDFLDWVEVRDKPYPIGPVDLAGRRS
jgi:gluconate 2-dehydrogenase gamma chain